MSRPTPERPDLSEKGRGPDGPTSSDNRLFMQLLVFTGCDDTRSVCDALDKVHIQPVATGKDETGTGSGCQGLVVYEDVNDPMGIAILSMTQDPAWWVHGLRPVLQREPFNLLEPRHELTMIGRSYAIGYEPDLDETLLHRPMRHALDADTPWAVWYPLRRGGAFEKLPRDEKMEILREHGTIGMAYGAHDLAQDVRLASHALDAADNEFTIGLMGRELTPLSKLVETMRGTRQTSEFITSLGPFFVGHAVWRRPMAL